MTAKKTLYLANPYGFSGRARAGCSNGGQRWPPDVAWRSRVATRCSFRVHRQRGALNLMEPTRGTARSRRSLIPASPAGWGRRVGWRGGSSSAEPSLFAAATSCRGPVGSRLRSTGLASRVGRQDIHAGTYRIGRRRPICAALIDGARCTAEAQPPMGSCLVRLTTHETRPAGRHETEAVVNAEYVACIRRPMTPRRRHETPRGAGTSATWHMRSPRRHAKVTDHRDERLPGGRAGVLVPRRFSSVHRQRGLPAQPDVVHRPAGDRLGGRVVRLARGDR